MHAQERTTCANRVKSGCLSGRTFRKELQVKIANQDVSSGRGKNRNNQFCLTIMNHSLPPWDKTDTVSTPRPRYIVHKRVSAAGRCGDPGLLSLFVTIGHISGGEHAPKCHCQGMIAGEPARCSYANPNATNEQMVAHPCAVQGGSQSRAGIISPGKIRKGKISPPLQTPKLTPPHARTALPKTPDFAG